MDDKIAAVLLRDFTGDEIGHKPATWCKTCIDMVRQRTGHACPNHKYEYCKNCRTKITTGHTCLDFVGHADVRARLCEADPEWTWAPYDFPGVGTLVMNGDSPVGMWIMLTVGGVSKPGYGTCERNKNEAVKELIGDAIRNAAQSFGVAWKLWAKGERGQGGTQNGNGRDEESFENATAAPPRNANGRRPAPAQPPEKSGEPDPDAQPFADEASQCTTLTALGEVNRQAREKHKLAALIRDPATGKTGGLGQYINWRKRQLEDAEAAFRELQAAAAARGLEGDGEIDEHVRRVTGAEIEGATAAQLREAAKALAEGVPA